VDVYTLKKKAFTVPSSKTGETLLSILESPERPKVFFDVRNDSDALFSHFGVKQAGVIDLQLMELATRSYPKRCVNGLAKCIDRDAPITEAQRGVWRESKDKGRQLFAPELGRSYEEFNARPLPESILAYCAQDVHILPDLWRHYDSRMSLGWKEKVEREAIDRVKQSQSPSYDGKGRHMALGPWRWW
jgi:exonuclease 3'-5' domain-containing protein 1